MRTVGARPGEERIAVGAKKKLCTCQIGVDRGDECAVRSNRLKESAKSPPILQLNFPASAPSF